MDNDIQIIPRDEDTATGISPILKERIALAISTATTLVGHYTALHPELQPISTMIGICGAGLVYNLNTKSFNSRKKAALLIESTEFITGKPQEELVKLIESKPAAAIILEDVLEKSSESESDEKVFMYASLFCSFLTKENISSANVLKILDKLKQMNDIQTNLLYRAILADRYLSSDLYDVTSKVFENGGIEINEDNGDAIVTYISEEILTPLVNAKLLHPTSNIEGENRIDHVRGEYRMPGEYGTFIRDLINSDIDARNYGTKVIYGAFPIEAIMLRTFSRDGLVALSKRDK